MSQPPQRITFGEQAARRLMLVRAIETGDTQHKLLSPAERDEASGLAVESVRSGSPASTDATRAFLQERALRLLRVLENRNPALASLSAARPWSRWLSLTAFLAAIIFGAATDRIANPHRVDLLSLPLLTLIIWNVVIYCVLIASYFLRRQPSPDARPAAALFVRWTDGLRDWQRRSSQLRAHVTAVFIRGWYGASSALQTQRLRKILHLAAAGWALGLALSLFTRGLVVEYRVGWESTFLDASQVHAILRVLLMPVAALFPFQAFDVQDIASFRFSNGSGAVAGARWVYIYATLLAVVVIMPRLALAFYSGWRERMLSRRIVLNLTDPYYQRLLAMLNPTRIQLGVVALRDEDRQALLRVLRPEPQKLDAGAATNASPQTLIRTDNGEALCIADIQLAGAPQPPHAALNAPSQAWMSRLFGRLRDARDADSGASADSQTQDAIGNSDVLLLVVRGAEEFESIGPFVQASGKPALLLINASASAAVDTGRDAAAPLSRSEASASGPQIEALGFERFAKCWVQDPIFLHALGRCMPGPKKETFARLVDAWLKRNDTRFAESMQLIAKQLLDAAREVEEVHSALPYFKRLTSLADRQADAQARQDAMAAVAERLRLSVLRSHAELLRLNGIDDANAVQWEQPPAAKFDFQAPINRAEAGLAGAATGAASGASIDLVTGGLTLGMATALGALIGGGAAFAGAAWKNRATPAGKTLVQLSDDMLQAVAAAALLRYLVITDFGRGARAAASGETAGLRERKVAAAVEAKRETFTRFWAEARVQQGQLQITGSLGGELQTVMRSVLDALYSGGAS